VADGSDGEKCGWDTNAFRVLRGEETLLVTNSAAISYACRCTCDATIPRPYDQPLRRRTSQIRADRLLLVGLGGCADATVLMPFEM